MEAIFMKFGYARVSTNDQNLEMQITALEKYGVEKIFSDKATGKNIQRKEFICCFLLLLQQGQ